LNEFADENLVAQDSFADLTEPRQRQQGAAEERRCQGKALREKTDGIFAKRDVLVHFLPETRRA
jgi:hypothetical protein